MKRKARVRMTPMREAAQLNSHVEVILGSMCATTRITETYSTFAKLRRLLELEDQISTMPATTKEAKFFRVSTVFIITAKFQDPK